LTTLGQFNPKGAWVQLVHTWKKFTLLVNFFSKVNKFFYMLRSIIKQVY